VALSIDATRVVHSVAPEYISFNFDWHLNTEEPPAWVNSSVLAINLTDPNLRTLTAALSPAHLRIGGSEGDNVTYAFGGAPCPANTSFCLTPARWAEIVEFASATGVSIAFGLNAMAGRPAGGHWDPSSAAAFLAACAAANLTAPGTLFAFEFGNELEYKVNNTAYAEDVVGLRATLDALWPAGGAAGPRPKLIANDENPSVPTWNTILPIAGPSMDIATWHLYDGYGLDPTLPGKAWDRGFLDTTVSTAAPLLKAAAGFLAGGGQIAVGETAMAWHSGQNGTTNGYLSGPWFITQLGYLASTHAFQCRQTLLGGNYELVDKWTLTPNPDYWTALLWKRVMGAGVLAATSNSSDVIAFAHCGGPAAGGGVAVAWVNLANETSYTVDVTGLAAGAPVPRHEYHLTAVPGDYRGIALNGAQLTYAGGALSPTPPVVVTDPSVPLVLAPHTYGFVVFPAAPSPCGGGA
jgi:heparanase